MAAITDSTELPESSYSLLVSHLPHSLALLRRIQFMNIPGGKSDNSHILALIDGVFSEAFVLAYLDFSRGPETEMWLYSSIERGSLPSEVEAQCEAQIIQVLKRVGEIEQDYVSERDTPGVVLIGSLHERVLEVTRKWKAVSTVRPLTEPYYKYIFQSEDLPEQKKLGGEGEGEGLKWGRIGKENIPLVLSRTAIPRKERTLTLLPSASIIPRGSPSPIAWGFLGADASLTSLHVEVSSSAQNFILLFTSI